MSTIITEFAPADRYVYDFGACSYAKGWAQVDTKQDASYYGTWTNPERLEIFTYCEGDTTLVRCESTEDYVSEVRKMADWNKENGYWKGIDPGFDPDMIAKFHALGFADLLH